MVVLSPFDHSSHLFLEVLDEAVIQAELFSLRISGRQGPEGSNLTERRARKSEFEFPS